MTPPTTRNPAPMAPRLQGAGLTHVGRVRTENEDSILTDPAGLLWAVADGMGGQGHGAMASDIVIDHVAKLDDHAPAAPTLRAALLAANAAILDLAAQQNLGQIGATAVVALIQSCVAHLAWAGDCRAYLLRAGHLRLLSRDHTVVQEMIDEGLLSDENRERHPQRHVVTRAVGADPALEIDHVSAPLVPGDRLLLCSDGLTTCLPDSRIADLISAAGDPREACTDLLRAALEAGAPDNVSVIVVGVEG
ncbi:protein phosphatase 2C domain-containing protein [Salipiger sp. 1_MG-2023]|uniref:PP2C family protein-serine/threonine phosphatase n=1 Tax=Salipiger sp. 1_MG-2023 TaxID=3062665 RepID=UPI0026E3985A|nr:protein phosphatase 2C domain-containing protein [Salipiger sp. 1_MG-2023]MDO6584929.1 protein phosphatase 2C domain-containing protein [Salipiger sp. 1_MG-2023]